MQYSKIFGNGQKEVSKLSILGGSGGSLVNKAKELNCHAIITSDISYHQGQLAEQLDIAIIDAGHYHTEVVVLDELVYQLNRKLIGEVEVVKTSVNACPYSFV